MTVEQEFKRTPIRPLPALADENMNRKERQQVFDKVKEEVGNVAVANFEQTITIIKKWLDNRIA